MSVFFLAQKDSQIVVPITCSISTWSEYLFLVRNYVCISRDSSEELPKVSKKVSVQVNCLASLLNTERVLQPTLVRMTLLSENSYPAPPRRV